MTEPNNTPNDPADQESLDDVLRGLSSEGSEEEQSLDDILASLSEDASEETLPAESIDTDNLLSDINDLKSDVFVEPPVPTSSSSEPEPSASTFNLNAMPSDVESLLAESEEQIDAAGVESLRSEAREQASPFDAVIPSQPIDETILSADTIESGLTDFSPESTAEPVRGWGDDSLTPDSQIPESISGMGAESETLNDSALPEPEELISFGNDDTRAPLEDVTAAASPFDPQPISQSTDDIGSPFSSPAGDSDTLESPFGDATESSSEPPSTWGNAPLGAESQTPDSTLDSSAEPEPWSAPSVPAREDATPFDVNADVAASSPFEPPATPSQPEAPASPFSESASDTVEPAFTSFVGSDSSTVEESPESPIEDTPFAAETERGDFVDETPMIAQPSSQASDQDPPSVPDVGGWGNEPNLTPLETPAVEPDVPAAAFNPPETKIDEPATPEPSTFNDAPSDPDLGGPALPSLPPLTQPTFSGTGESLSQASIDKPTSTATDSESDEPMKLNTLLDRPRHRWLVPFGFIMILVIFGAIIFGVLRGSQDSEPAPENQEQSSLPSRVHGAS